MPLDNNIKFNLKLFCINTSHYELKNKAYDEIINVIRENHKKHFFANNEDLRIAKPHLKKYETEQFKFYSYCYNQSQSLNYWKLFLPDELTEEQNFDVVEFSYVLFIIYNSTIYCVIGGSGINVIKKYIDPYFGIDLYQHFAKPNEDISIAINTRAITGNLSQRSNTYNNNQTIKESLDYTEIPKKIKIIVREELKLGLFKKYKLDPNLAIMDIGAYFSIRKKLNFNELQSLIIDIDNIKRDKSKYIQLSLFNKLTDELLIDKLDKELKSKLIDNILLHVNPSKLYLLNSDIIEVVNQNKIEKFYECDIYYLKLKGTRKNKTISVTDKENLLYECTKYIYDNLSDKSDRYAIENSLYKLNLTGSIDNKETTFGTFYSHINAEIPLGNKKYFRIDEQWFYLDDYFLSLVNNEALNYYNQYKLEKNILNHWSHEMDEDSYNKSHNKPNYYVFDKIIKDNIELCDLLYIDDNNIYLVHIKDHFNTQMRVLSNQIILSAKRLWSDLNTTKENNYFKSTIALYNSRNPERTLNAEELFSKIINNQAKVHFVMAYNNRRFRTKTSLEKIEKSESNIAKFSIVQTVKEVQNFSKMFSLRIIDISEIS